MALIVPAGMVSAEGIENVQYRETKIPDCFLHPEKYEGKKRPLQVILFNIMPDAIATETHFMDVMEKTGYDVEMTFLKTASYSTKRVDPEYFAKYYCTLDEIRDYDFDGIMYTGAPLGFIHFDDIFFKQDWIDVADWGEANVNANLFICWSAFAYYFYRYGVFWDEYEKMGLYNGKFSGVYPNKILAEDKLLEGMSNPFPAPQSRERGTNWKDMKFLEDNGTVKVLAECETGPTVTKILGTKTFLNLAHLEYDQYRLDAEVQRDGGRNGIPKYYYPDDDITKEPVFNWRADGIRYYTNWIKYYVSVR